MNQRRSVTEGASRRPPPAEAREGHVRAESITFDKSYISTTLKISAATRAAVDEKVLLTGFHRKRARACSADARGQRDALPREEQPWIGEKEETECEIWKREDSRKSSEVPA